jgi:lipopolysaccharide transport system ATP-binding protein
MTPPSIHAQRLSKQYVVRASRQRHPTARFALAEAASRIARRASALGRHTETRRETVWALRDVSFEVEEGEVVGVIGRNGAGKSTLLKILTRITEPSSGWADVRGRVGSLLEVGTGFHPELTGRENVYLHGAILGMRKREIDRRFDEIVAFAEVEPFLETPVKRFSSGMVVRLAFAVSAHFEPNILLVDEVLAVGDVSYQRKCLTKMREVAHEGRTVLLVSHNMATLQALCDRGLLIEKGVLRADGPMRDVVAGYLSSLEESVSENLLERTDRRGKQEIRLVRVQVTGSGPTSGSAILATGWPARFVFEVTGSHAVTGCSFTIYDEAGQAVTTLTSAAQGPDDRFEPGLEQACVCEVDALPLVPGRYRIDVAIRGNGKTQDAIDGAAMFDVEEGTLAGRPVARDGTLGVVALPHRWTLPGRARDVL